MLTTASTKSRALARYTHKEYVSITEPGMYHDGGGLYLSVSPSGAKSWLFRYMFSGRARAMGLGSFRFVPVAKARKKARDAGELLADGIDPLDARGAQQADDRLVNYEQYSRAFMASRASIWKDGTRSIWLGSQENYAYPKIGGLQPRLINLNHIRSVVDPIWTEKPKSAKRLLHEIEVVLDYAKALDPQRDQPVRWR